MSAILYQRVRWSIACLFFGFFSLLASRGATFYVKPTGNDGWTGTSWNTAKQTIQAAVNLANSGDTVRVTNGIYSTGTTVTPGFSTLNRVVITNNILLKSVNGAAVTSIRGLDNGNVASSVRGVYMTAGTLDGFTVSHSRAPTIGPDGVRQDIWGGGAYAPGGTLINCVISGNGAAQGGGVAYGTLTGCTVKNNTANSGGGAVQSTLTSSTLSENNALGGGGAYDSILYACLIVSNSAGLLGGGTSESTLYGCTLAHNTAGLVGGGGSFNDTLNNCLITDNTADTAGGAYASTLINCTVANNSADNGGGAALSTLRNSIVYFNTDTAGNPNNYSNTFAYSCTTPMPTSGVGNITGAPLFPAANDYRLATNSPGINAGNNALVAGESDIDGNPRIEDGTVDMGAYEISRTRYVSPNGAAIHPYSRWADAATTIQDAVDAAEPGDQVRVTNGIYNSGTRVTPGFATSNRLVITKNIAVSSVNGPAVTVIQGVNAGDSLTSVRPLYMSSGTLSGFTLTGGYAQGLPPTNPQNRDGGGAYMAGGSLSNCWLIGNSATSGFGGGVRGGTLTNCRLADNEAQGGGGAHSAVLFDSVLLNNTATFNDGGGASSSDLTRCEVTGNTAAGLGGGAKGGEINNSLFQGNYAPAVGAVFFASLSNCTVIANSASNVGGIAWSTALNCIVYDNEDLAGSPNYEQSGFDYSCTTPMPTSGVGNIASAPGFASAGSPLLSTNSPCINAGNNAFVAPGSLDLAGRLRIVDGVVDMGAYEFDIYPVHYVAPGGASIAPYSSWDNAATNIQDAIDAAKPGEVVLVSNGVYNTGARLTPGYASSNRIVLTKDITVRSVNGPLVTHIAGVQNGINYGSVRVAYLSAGVLSGFTLTNGATPGVVQDLYPENDGGGAYLTAGGRLENCLVTGNEARGLGGGVRGGTLNACTLRGNVAVAGGGAANATLNNCAVLQNISSQSGGGTAYSTLNNCSVANNIGYLGLAGGSYGDTVRNSIVYSNIVVILAQGGSPNRWGSTFTSSCTTPMPAGAQNGGNNITGNPQFVNVAGGDLRLQPTSPCIDTGSNGFVVGTADLAGNDRMVNAIVDMGAYEYFLDAPTGYWAWAAAITNGLTNLTDSATGDDYPNLLKYATGSSATQPDGLAELSYSSDGSERFLTFYRNTEATDVTLILQASDSMTNEATWVGIATNTGGSWGGNTNVVEIGATSPVQVSVSDDGAGSATHFNRLYVTRP